MGKLINVTKTQFSLKIRKCISKCSKMKPTNVSIKPAKNLNVSF